MLSYHLKNINLSKQWNEFNHINLIIQRLLCVIMEKL